MFVVQRNILQTSYLSKKDTTTGNKIPFKMKMFGHKSSVYVPNTESVGLAALYKKINLDLPKKLIPQTTLNMNKMDNANSADLAAMFEQVNLGLVPKLMSKPTFRNKNEARKTIVELDKIIKLMRERVNQSDNDLRMARKWFLLDPLIDMAYVNAAISRFGESQKLLAEAYSIASDLRRDGDTPALIEKINAISDATLKINGRCSDYNQYMLRKR